MHRRSFLRYGATTALGSMLAVPLLAGEPHSDIAFAEDFDELWTTLHQRYCFFTEKRTDWNRVRAMYRPMAESAPDDDAFLEVLRRVLAELYDTHTHLSNPADGSPRWPPYDLIVAQHGESATITAIAENSAASDAGLVIGDTILAVDGRPVAQVARDLAPKCLVSPDPAAEAYIWNSAVAGRRGQPRRFLIKKPGSPAREVALPIKARTEKPDLEWRRLDDGMGYIAIRSFADEKVAKDFDQALAELRETTGLIIDVRDNGGGDTAVARPIMGRFISEQKPYALMRRRQGRGLSAFWTETVEPNGPFTYTRPVVVLTNHWSGSMAEGFPMGMRSIGRASIIGTRMMALGAAVFPIRLDRTGVQAQYSAEPVYDARGAPRWLMTPDVEVPDGEDILAAGLRVLKAAISS